MNEIDEAVKNAVSNLDIDGLKVTDDQVQMIKESLIQKDDVKELIKKMEEKKVK